VAIASSDAACTTHWFKDTCLTKSEVPTGFHHYYASGDPCFSFSGMHACFTSITGNRGHLGFCDPAAPGCSGGSSSTGDEGRSSNEGGSSIEGGSSTGDDNNSGTMTCDNSNLASSDCTNAKAKYCAINKEHTMCKYCGTNESKCNKVCSREIKSQAEIDAIVAKHNELRRKIAKGEETKGVGGGQPSATDMYELKWNDELAQIAQTWADQCTRNHDKQRGTDKYGHVGQNIARSGSSAPFSSTRNYDSHIQGWYDEVKDFPPGNVQKFSFDKATGHYTQLAWGATKEVGCGFVAFSTGDGDVPYQQYLICNYGVGGNMGNSAVYNPGTTASACPNGSNDGLCTW